MDTGREGEGGRIEGKKTREEGGAGRVRESGKNKSKGILRKCEEEAMECIGVSEGD